MSGVDAIDALMSGIAGDGGMVLSSLKDATSKFTRPQTETMTNNETIPQVIYPLASCRASESPAAVTYLKIPQMKTSTVIDMMSGASLLMRSKARAIILKSPSPDCAEFI